MSPADVLEMERNFVFDDPKTKRRLTLKVGTRPFDVELAFQVWLEEQALRAVVRQRNWLSPADYSLQHDSWQRLAAAGAYDFTGLAAYQARASRVGRLELLYLDLAYFNPETTRELVERIGADAAKAEELAALLERVNAPFRPAPEPIPPPDPDEGAGAAAPAPAPGP